MQKLDIESNIEIVSQIQQKIENLMPKIHNKNIQDELSEIHRLSLLIE